MEWVSGKQEPAAQHCDIFCNVVDNFGDIGVSWRLARQLAAEYACRVRLWVDDLPSLSRLCNAVDVSLEKQFQRGVEICRWRGDFSKMRPAELVIEAFGCALPEPYIEAMAELVPQPVWINLEYLSAETWVREYHGLPSPHPRLPLTKYFFFPGFTEQTGGLLRERDLLLRRDVFQRDTALQQAFWQSVGIAMPAEGRLKISLFGYENAALSGLLQAWTEGAHPVLCLVPEGRILPQIGQYFSDDAPCVGKTYVCGNLQVRVLPFVEQERYDELLWACDVNFVRGEDSFVRAQWAGKPLVWQIYPQHDAVHWEKLQAFLSLYNSRLSAHAAESVQGLWRAWNMEHEAGQAWPAFAAACAELQFHAQCWPRQLADNNLALNLLDFSRKIGRMRAFEIEGQ